MATKKPVQATTFGGEEPAEIVDLHKKKPQPKKKTKPKKPIKRVRPVVKKGAIAEAMGDDYNKDEHLAEIGKYKSIYAEQVKALCLMGLSDEELGAVFQVSPKTVAKWMETIPEFGYQAMQGRVIADSQVAAALFQRAIGFDSYEYKAFVIESCIVQEKVPKHIIPDVSAAKHWLSKRQPGKWDDTTLTVNSTSMDEAELDKKFGAIMEKMQKSATEIADDRADLED